MSAYAAASMLSRPANGALSGLVRASSIHTLRASAGYLPLNSRWSPIPDTPTPTFLYFPARHYTSTSQLRSSANTASKTASAPSRSIPAQNVPASKPPRDAGQQVDQPNAGQSVAKFDGVNPPVSTLPARIDVPSRSEDQSFAHYLFQTGKIYARFYKDGVKAVWRNHKAAKALRKQNRQRAAPTLSSAAPHSSSSSSNNFACALPMPGWTRAEYQLLVRNAFDISRLPFFAVLFILVGEWLPLVVFAFSNAVPWPCRIPSQVDADLWRGEDRRADAAKKLLERAQRKATQGMPVVAVTPWLALEGKTLALGRKELMEAVASMRRRFGLDPIVGGAMNAPYASSSRPPPSSPERLYVPRPMLLEVLLPHLDRRALLHMARALDLHAHFWDHIPEVVPLPWDVYLRYTIRQRVRYLAYDDAMIMRDAKGAGVAALSAEEVKKACAERGLDVRGKDEGTCRKELGDWVKTVDLGMQ